MVEWISHLSQNGWSFSIQLKKNEVFFQSNIKSIFFNLIWSHHWWLPFFLTKFHFFLLLLHLNLNLNWSSSSPNYACFCVVTLSSSSSNVWFTTVLMWCYHLLFSSFFDIHNRVCRSLLYSDNGLMFVRIIILHHFFACLLVWKLWHQQQQQKWYDSIIILEK